MSVRLGLSYISGTGVFGKLDGIAMITDDFHAYNTQHKIILAAWYSEKDKYE